MYISDRPRALHGPRALRQWRELPLLRHAPVCRYIHIVIYIYIYIYIEGPSVVSEQRVVLSRRASKRARATVAAPVSLLNKTLWTWMEGERGREGKREMYADARVHDPCVCTVPVTNKKPAQNDKCRSPIRYQPKSIPELANGSIIYSTLHYSTYSTLVYHDILCYGMQRYGLMRFALLCYPMPYTTTQHNPNQTYTVLYFTILY